MKLKNKIKKELKQDKKVKEVPTEFFNTTAVYCIQNELHIKTVYQLCRVKHIEQMLISMYETTVKEYTLHTPTLEKLKEEKIREEVNSLIKKHKLTVPII